MLNAAVAEPRRLGANLLPEEVRYYSRHLIIPEVSVSGQRALKGARVLIVGAGGLGSPVALYLAAAGVGTVGLVDFDTVDESNLHRQVLYTVDDVGRPKLDCAAERLRRLNPHVAVERHSLRLSRDNAFELIDRYDLVIDGTDNFPTRYLVNDACVLLRKPNVHASIFRFEGQLSVFWAGHGPCYRCLYPEPPPPGLVPSCAEGGVLGVLPGILGTLQANTAINLLLGIGESLAGRLLVFDAARMRFKELRIERDPACPICSESPSQTGLVDYEAFCAPTSASDATADVDEISVRELDSLRRSGHAITLVDVRSPAEFEIARIPGSRLIPLPELESRAGELERDRLIVCHCHTGKRSLAACRTLQKLGFTPIANLAGGIDAWSREVDDSVPRY